MPGTVSSCRPARDVPQEGDLPTAALARKWWPSVHAHTPIESECVSDTFAQQPANLHPGQHGLLGAESPISHSTSVAACAEQTDCQHKWHNASSCRQVGRVRKAAAQPAVAQCTDSTKIGHSPGHGYDSPPERPRTPARATAQAHGSRGGPIPFSPGQAHASGSPFTEQQSSTSHTAVAVDAKAPRISCTPKPAMSAKKEKQAGTVLYAAMFLNPESRKELLERSPPLYKRRLANHMTLAYQPSAAILSSIPLGEHAQLTVLGFACDTACQALIVEPPDTLADFAPHAPHITISVTVGTENREAGNLASRILEDEQQQQAHFRPCNPWTLTGQVGVRMSDGRALFSRSEMERETQLCKVLKDLETALQPEAGSGQATSTVRPTGQPERASSAAQPCSLQSASSAPQEQAAAHASDSHSCLLTAWQQQGAKSEYTKAVSATGGQAAAAQVTQGSSPDDSCDGPQLTQFSMRKWARYRRHIPHAPSVQASLLQPGEGTQHGRQSSPPDADVQDTAWEQETPPSQHDGMHAGTSPGGWWDDLQGLPDARRQERRQARRGRCWTPEQQATKPDRQVEAAQSTQASSSAPDSSLLSAWTQHCSAASPASGLPLPVASAAGQQSLPVTKVHSTRRPAASQPVPIRKSAPAARNSHRKWQSSGPSGGSSASDTEQAGQQRPSTGSSEGSPPMHGQAPPVDEAAARDMAKAAVARRDATSRLADQERRLADMHATSASIFQRAAKDAFDQGDFAVGKELSGRSKEHMALAADARVRANADAYDAHNAGITNRFKIDLHGLNVDEAMAMLDRHLANLGGLSAPGGILLQVVTGVGKHSAGGQPRILPAVVRSLRESGLQFWSQPDNAGMVEVLLPASRHSPCMSGS